jgi:hypothetical protein
MSNPTMTIINRDRRVFIVEYVAHPPVDKWHPDEPREPMVKFYDHTYADDQPGIHSRFGPLGQYVADYYVETLLTGNQDHGLCLNGGVPVWQIDRSSMMVVRMWLHLMEDRT